MLRATMVLGCRATERLRARHFGPINSGCPNKFESPLMYNWLPMVAMPRLWVISTKLIDCGFDSLRRFTRTFTRTSIALALRFMLNAGVVGLLGYVVNVGAVAFVGWNTASRSVGLFNVTHFFEPSHFGTYGGRWHPKHLTSKTDSNRCRNFGILFYNCVQNLCLSWCHSCHSH